jgi:hypothetical protein
MYITLFLSRNKKCSPTAKVIARSASRLNLVDPGSAFVLWFYEKGTMMNTRKFYRTSLIAATALILVLGTFIFPTKSVKAAIFTVNEYGEGYDGACDEDCSLRDAVAEANASAGADTIVLPAGTYFLSQPGITDTTGDIDIRDELVITGAGSALTIIHANTTLLDRIFDVDSSTNSLGLTGLTLEGGNTTTGKGGAIFSNYNNLNFEDVVIRNSTAAAEGGGVYMEGGGLFLLHSEISGNHSGGDGGGVNCFGASLVTTESVIRNNTAAGEGGGIYVNSGELNITTSRVEGNSGGKGGGIFVFMGNSPFSLSQSLVKGNTSGNEGGGIYLYSYGTSQADIVNSTISGNLALNNGGGIYSEMPVNIRHSTIAENQADTDHSEHFTPTGGGIYGYRATGVFHISNSILANNTGNYWGLDPNNDCYLGVGGSVASQGYNLVEYPGICGFSATGDRVSVDPHLGPLQDNGGLTHTYALLPGSPAVDKGDPAFAPPPDFDQRGFPRVFGSRIDMGAYEAQFIKIYMPILMR